MLPCICELKKNLQIFEMSLDTQPATSLYMYFFVIVMESLLKKISVWQSHSGHLLDVYEIFLFECPLP